MGISVDEAVEALSKKGYFATTAPVPQGRASSFILGVARQLGEVYVPPDCDPEEPVIRTAPTEDDEAAPFDRPEAIGWHGDFATHVDRPELSFVYVTRPDPRGVEYGAWRLACGAQVLEALSDTAAGREAFDLLCREPLPLTYAEDQAPNWFQVIEPRPEGRLGLRFYAPSIRRGCMAHYGEVPRHVESAITAVERAADQVQEVVPTETGSLLITNNWFALHDRARQTVNPNGQSREALLCFVKRQEIGFR